MKVSRFVSWPFFVYQRRFLTTLLLLITAVCAISVAAQEPFPAAPRVFIDTTWSPPVGNTWNVNTSTTFQQALNASQPGDTIILDNHVVYTGNFNLPAKTNPANKWIYIESSALANLPPPGTRVGPTDAPNMPKIATPNANSAITIAPDANHYRFVGLEVTSQSNQGCRPLFTPPINCFTYILIYPPVTDGQSGHLVDSITVDRCYLHGSDTYDVREAVDANGTNFAVIDSYISDIHQSSSDSQAIEAWQTPGPIKIVNNFLSASTEEVMFGGAGGADNPYVPSDIEIRNNHMFKPLAWDACGAHGTLATGQLQPNGVPCPPLLGYQWVVKNNLEFKSAQRVIVTGNTLENTWISGQTGRSVLFTPRNYQSGNIAVVDDIEFANNLLKNVDSGFSTLEQDTYCGVQWGNSCTNAGESKRVWAHDNLILLSANQDTYQHTWAFIDGGNTYPRDGLTDYIFQHNTALMIDGSSMWPYVFELQSPVTCPPTQASATHNIWILDNALARQPIGDCGYGGLTGLGYYMSDPAPVGTRYWGNAMFAPSGDKIASWPPHNFATGVPFVYQDPANGDYRLQSPYWTDTTDGKVAGIDWASLQQASTTELTSGEGSLYATQSTTLTGTVSVSGGGGAPTGTVNFMLGTTVLGTGTLSPLDGTDATASMQLQGSQLVLGPNSITAVYSGDSNYQASTSPAITVTLLSSEEGFGTVNVGTAAPVATLNYTFNSDARLTAIDILTMGVANLDYTDGGSSTCQVGTQYTAGQSCTVTVGFTPRAPGMRAGAVTLFAQGSNQPLMTWYVSGVGESPAVTIDPGTQTTLATIANAATYGSAVDGAGNLYVADEANGQVVEIAAGTEVQTVVAGGLSAPTSVALDGAGNLYIAASSGVVLVPNENGTLNAADQVTLSIAGLGLAQGLAEDGNGNLYVADSGTGTVLEVALGVGTPQTIASGLTNPHAVAVDAAGNVYVASDSEVNEYPAGGGTAVALGTGYRTPQGVAVDAAGTVYVADTGNAQVVKVEAGGQEQSVLPVSGLTAPHGVTVDAGGNVYVSDSSQVYEVNRVQAAPLNFGDVGVGTTSPAQTLQVSNSGNQQLTVSSLTIAGDYQQQASGGSDCSGSTQLAAGTGCAIAVAFSPTTTGVLNGTVTLSDNALNNPASQQTVNLTGTGAENQQPQTITFPNPGAQTYGVAPITLTATASSGLPVSYTVISGPATVNGNTLTITGAGSVTVEANQAGDEQWLPAPPVDDTFTVDPAVLTVTANSATMTYGGTLPTFTASYSGFVNGDTQGVLSGAPSLTTTATSQSPVGNYPITAAQGTLSAQNYAFAFVNGTLTINPAVLTVTADNAAMTYGGTLPTFTASYSGFVNGDTQGVLSGSPSLTTTATSQSPVGNYPITAAQGTLSAQNYTFVFVNGTLTIVPASTSSLLTSGLTSLYSTQSTTLTGTVSVSGGGGAPTGTVNFMLGTTVLGTGTLSPLDGTDATASMQLQGSQLVLGPNSITAVYSGDSNYQASTSPAITVTLLSSEEGFGTVSVGTAAPVQTLNYTFSADAQLTAIDILTMGVAGLDYTDGGSSSCQVGTQYTAGQSCTVTVGFTPRAPGMRAGAVTLYAQGSNLPLMTWYVSGVGESPAVTIDPGTQTTLATITNAATYGSAVDGAGNVYVADEANGQAVEIAAGTEVQTVVASGLSAPTAVALDGAGNLYIAESSGVVLVPNENGTLNTADQTTLSIAGLGLAQGLAEDGNGNLYVADSGTGTVLEVPLGVGTPQTIASGLTNPHAVAVDAAGNVYVASDNQVSEYPAGGGTAIPLGTGYRTPQGVAVDAAGTVYVADTGNAQVVKVEAGGQEQSVLPVSGLTAPHGVTVDAGGNVYVSDSSQVYEVNRGQAAQLNFGDVGVGTTSPAQTLQVSNSGNQQLTVSSLAVAGDYQQQASGGSDCSGSTQLAAGTGCAIAVAFSPTTTGVLNGTVTLSDNALNNPASQQTVNLTGTGAENQQPQTITFPNPGTQTYGVVPITLTATASSGLPVTYTVISGPATVNGNTLTITGAGSVTVEANQAGDEQWLPAPPVDDTFTVDPAVLTVTANNAAMTYGGTLPAFTASYSGFVNGDTQGVLSGSPSLTTTATSQSPVGNYPITAAQGTLSAQNYTFTFVNGTLTINPAVLTVTANNAAMTYGGTLPTFTASYSGFVNGDTQGVLSGSPSLTTTATSQSPVGNYPITAAQGTLSAQNYTFAFVNGTLSIVQASTSSLLTSGLTSLYSTQSTTLTGTVSVSGGGGAPTGTVNFMLGTTVLGTGTLSPLDGTDATASMQLQGSQLVLGPNSITAVYSGDSNYQASTSPAITVTLLSSEEGFGTVSVGTAAPVETLNYTFSADARLTAIDILTMGVAGLDYTDGGSSTCQVGTQYTAGQSCTVTVGFTPRAPGMRAGAVTLFAQGSNQPLMTWYVSGVGESPAVTIDPGTQTTLATITNAATYGSAVDGAGNVYVADEANGQVVEIAAGTETQTVVAGGLSAPTAVALDGAGNLYIAQSSGVVLVPNENGTLNAADQTTVQISGLGLAQGLAADGNGNLYVADSGTGTVLEVALGGGTPQTIASGLTNPHAVAVDAVGNVYVASDNQVNEYPAGGGTAIPLGTGYRTPQGVAVDASGTVYVADTGNARAVKVAAGGQEQSVLPVSGLTAPHGLTVDAGGNVYVSDSGQVYAVNRVQAAPLNFGDVGVGTTSPAQTLQVSNSGNQQLTVSGLTIAENYQQQASGGSDCSGSTQLTAGAGCAIAVAFSPTTTGVLNGAVTLSDNALNNPASQQTVNLTGTGTQGQQEQTITFPNPGTQTYGVAPINLTATASSGLPVTYTVISGPATVNGSTLTITGAGSVTVEANQAGDEQWLPAPPVDDTFTVNPAVLTVTANNASMTYGGTLPTFTASYSGFVNGDTQGVLSGSPSLTTSATSGSPVGNYAITAALGTLSAQNYSFVFVNGTLSINPAVLTVTADNAAMTYGGTLPTFTASYSGFVNGDTQGVLSGSPSLTTTATSQSPVGNYPITAAQGTLSAQNYTFVFVNGTLSINPAVLTVTANNAAMTYGGTLPTFTASYSGFVNGDTQGVLSGSPSMTTTATSQSPVGNYPIIAAQGTLSAQNYTFAFVNGTLTISPAVLTVTANNITAHSGQPLPPLTYTVSGFVNGDTQSVLSGSPSLTTTATWQSPVGNYPIIATQGTLSAQNYTFMFVNGTLTLLSGGHLGR